MITHSLFTDDTFIYGECNTKEVDVFSNVLNQYAKASRQNINFHKSEIIFSTNTSAEFREKASSAFGVKESSYTVKYIGIPMEWGITKKQMLKFLIQRTLEKIQSWKCKFLTQAGRETMIKAVLQALPAFVMSVFKIPIGIIQEIEKLI